jgi:hypothetical protein
MRLPTVARSKAMTNLLAHRVLGNDPGRCNLSFMAEVVPDGSTRSFRLTRGAYYEQSGTNTNKKLRKKCLSRFNDAWTKWASVKTVWLSDILENASQLGSTLEQVWEALSSRCLRRAKFAAWSGRTRVLDRYFRAVKRSGGDAPVYVALGDAMFAPYARGAPSAPTRRVEKRMSMFIGASHVKPVHEFRTTMMDYASGERLHRVVRLDRIHEKGKSVVITREVRGLKLSRSSETNLRLTGFSKRLVNRDLNSAVNLRLVGVSGQRPRYLKRGAASAQNKSLVLARRSHSRPTNSNRSAVRMMCLGCGVSHS